MSFDKIGEGGIRTRGTDKPYTAFPRLLLKPLGHLSKIIGVLYRSGEDKDQGLLDPRQGIRCNIHLNNKLWHFQ